MRSKLFRFFAVFVVLAMFLAPLSTRPVQADNSNSGTTLLKTGGLKVNNAQNFQAISDISPSAGDGKTADISGKVFGVSETGLYIVRLIDPSLSMYQGGIADLTATSPQRTGARNLDVKSPVSVAYLNYLSGKQAGFISAMDNALGRTVEVVYTYKNVLNGMAVRVSQQEANIIAKLTGVKAVYGDQYHEMDTDVGPIWIGAPAIWNGDTGTGESTQGEGVIIGMIDSGINHAHPSFAVTGGDGYTVINPYGSGVFHGYCATHAGFCNDKLIAAYDLYPGGSSGPEDTAGHGSHTASTAGGNRHEADFIIGTQEFTRTIQGVAPHANIIAYKVCNPSCPDSSSIEAVNIAITDTVDVLNYSISGSDDPWNDPVDQAFLDAFAAGIYVAASAGNAGPGAGTVAHTGPWNATVGASTHNRIFANNFDVTGPTLVPPALQNLPALQGNGTPVVTDIEAGITYSSSNLNGCSAFPAGFFLNKLALIQRGACDFSVKVANAYDAGAVAAIIFNNAGGPPSAMDVTGAPAIPSVGITNTDGQAVKDFIDANPTATAAIRANVAIFFNDNWFDVMAGFSSRGPSKFDLLKPDFVAPGVNILAAVAAAGADPVQYGFLNGTSMSSPHGAGSGALMIALHPDWSPAQIKSALETSTYHTTVTDSDGVTLANPFAMGSGRLALGDAGNVGLVLDETAANFAAANPATGGDPKTLNIPSFDNNACYQTCSWTRTVYNPTNTTMTWEGTYTGTGIATVNPISFTISSEETVTFTLSLDVENLTPDTWNFGFLTWSEASSLAPDVKMPVAFKPVRTTNPDIIDKQVSSDTATRGDNLTYTMTVQNFSAITNTYILTDAVPAHTSYVAGSATGGLVYDPGKNILTWSGKVGPSGLFIQEGFNTGYVSLAGLGVSPFQLPSNPDDGGFILTGMDFYYFGQHYDRVIWSVNGTIEVGSASMSTTPGINTSLPNPLPPSNLLAGWWTDLDLTSAGHWYVAGITDTVTNLNYTVFEWEAVPRFGDPSSTATFQIWFLDGTDNIWYAYPANAFTGSTTDGTIGAENDTGTIGDTYYFDGAGTLPDGSHDLLVVRLLSNPAVLTYRAHVTEMDNQVKNTVDLIDDHLIAQQAYALSQLVLEPPEITFTSNSPVTLGETAVFTPTVTGTNPFEFLWSFGDGITSTLESPTHTYGTTGVFTVTTTVTGAVGTATYSAPFEVKGVPPSATFTSNSPVIRGEMAVFTSTVTGTGPFEYLWTFGDGITNTLASPTHLYAVADTYTVTLKVTSEWGIANAEGEFVVIVPNYPIYMPIIFKQPTP